MSTEAFEPSPASARPVTPRKTVDRAAAKAAQVIAAGEAYDRAAVTRSRWQTNIARPIGDRELAALQARRGIHQPPGVRRAKLRAVMCATLVGDIIEREVIVVPRDYWNDCNEAATIGDHETAIRMQRHRVCFVLADRITLGGEVIQ
jgi:hypothetical protein